MLVWNLINLGIGHGAVVGPIESAIPPNLEYDNPGGIVGDFYFRWMPLGSLCIGYAGRIRAAIFSVCSSHWVEKLSA